MGLENNRCSLPPSQTGITSKPNAMAAIRFLNVDATPGSSGYSRQKGAGDRPSHPRYRHLEHRRAWTRGSFQPMPHKAHYGKSARRCPDPCPAAGGSARQEASLPRPSRPADRATSPRGCSTSAKPFSLSWLRDGPGPITMWAMIRRPGRCSLLLSAGLRRRSIRHGRRSEGSQTRRLFSVAKTTASRSLGPPRASSGCRFNGRARYTGA